MAAAAAASVETFSAAEILSVKTSIIRAIDHSDLAFFTAITDARQKKLYQEAIQTQDSVEFPSHLERALHWCFSKDRESKLNAAKVVTILVSDFKAPVPELLQPRYKKVERYLRETARPAIETTAGTETGGSDRRSMESISSDLAADDAPRRRASSWRGWSFARAGSLDGEPSGLPPLSARHAAAAGGAGGKRADSPDPRARGNSAARAFTPSSDDAASAAPVVTVVATDAATALTVGATLRKMSGVGDSFRARLAAAKEDGVELT